jgi:hypothetical protein
MLASPRGGLHSRFSLLKSDKRWCPRASGH